MCVRVCFLLEIKAHIIPLDERYGLNIYRYLMTYPSKLHIELEWIYLSVLTPQITSISTICFGEQQRITQHRITSLLWAVPTFHRSQHHRDVHNCYTCIFGWISYDIHISTLIPPRGVYFTNRDLCVTLKSYLNKRQWKFCMKELHYIEIIDEVTYPCRNP